MSFSRFDFEQQIMDCWGVVNDLDAISKSAIDRETPMTPDEIHNLLHGVSMLYEIKFQELFDQFSRSGLPLHPKE